MPVARPEVLAQGDDVHVRGAQIAHRLKDLLACLPKTEHDRRLRVQVAPGVLRVSEDRKALGIGRPPVSHDGLEPLDRLHVVVQDVDARVDDRAHRLHVPLEIGDERFDDHVRPPSFDFADRLREVPRPTVR